MILILIFVGLTVIGGVIMYFNEYAEGFLLGLFSVILALALLAIPISHATWKVNIVQFESRRASIQQQREQPITEYERVALSNSIVDYNMWLAGHQQAKKMKWVNWYIPKEILEIEPIK